MSELTIRHRLIAACHRSLKPLVRILLRAGVSYQDFEQLSQRVFVDVAPEVFGENKELERDAWISELTGISTTSVRAIQAKPRQELFPEIGMAVAAGALLHFWWEDPEYLDTSTGEPVHLPYNEGKKTFTKMAAKYGGGESSGALLKSLILSGAMEIDSKNKFYPTMRIYLGANVDEPLVDAIGSRLYFFLASAEENARQDHLGGNGRVERIVVTAIEKNKIEEVREVIRNSVTKYTEQLDKGLSQYESGEMVNVRKSDTIIGLGLYEIVGTS